MRSEQPLGRAEERDRAEEAEIMRPKYGKRGEEGIDSIGISAQPTGQRRKKTDRFERQGEGRE